MAKKKFKMLFNVTNNDVKKVVNLETDGKSQQMLTTLEKEAAEEILEYVDQSLGFDIYGEPMFNDKGKYANRRKRDRVKANERKKAKAARTAHVQQNEERNNAFRSTAREYFYSCMIERLISVVKEEKGLAVEVIGNEAKPSLPKLRVLKGVTNEVAHELEIFISKAKLSAEGKKSVVALIQELKKIF